MTAIEENKDRELLEALQGHMHGRSKFHLARLKALCLMVHAIIAAKSVILSDLANAVKTSALPDSVARRFSRLLGWLDIEMIYATWLLARLAGLEDLDRIVLVFDRTTWKSGNYVCNILQLCICMNGVAYPIAHMNLGRMGNSNTAQRIELMEIFFKHFPGVKEVIVLADREFIGEEWLGYLNEKNVIFYIRTRSDIRFTLPNGKKTNGKNWMKYVNYGKKRRTPEAVRIMGGEYMLYGLRHEKDDLIIVTNGDVEGCQAAYAERWSIECYFKCLKTRGFNVEDGLFRNGERLDALWFVLSVTYIICLKYGLIRLEKGEKIPLDGRKKPRYSVFYFGFLKTRKALTQKSDEIPDKEYAEVLSAA